MTSVTQFINSGAVGAGALKGRSVWCRPTHKPTCCMSIYNGSACCVCVPTTATCFIIEMWGQGGGGGGGCCCGVGPFGGQGGAYGWVACTTSGTNHILCACTCDCHCSTCTICTGTYGQFSRVCNCGGPGGFWCVCGGNQGCWTCAPAAPACCGSQLSNTWLFWKNCSAALACHGAINTSGVQCAQNLQFCCSQSASPIASTFAGCNVTAGNAVGTVTSNPLDSMWGNLCACACFSSPYVWLGACGWSDPATASTPFGCLNVTGIPNAACGGGMGSGGASYAGGDQAIYKCAFACSSCFVQCGNFPGGGGMSTWSATAWSNPGWGAPGLILISWC